MAAQLALTTLTGLRSTSVRMAVDTGEVERRGGDLFGSPMNRGSRLLNAAHGGQILLSNEVQKEISRDAGTQIKSLGEHRFKGLGAPIEVYQLLAGGLRAEFPAPQTASPAMELDRSFGDSIRGYELRERSDEGLATVYRGFQPSIGPEVAIKIVNPSSPISLPCTRGSVGARLFLRIEHPTSSRFMTTGVTPTAPIGGPYLASRSLATRLRHDVPRPGDEDRYSGGSHFLAHRQVSAPDSSRPRSPRQ